ncbi:MAG: hypothetical protein WDN28_25465 [Chthoniobacter sp.]
MQNWSYMLDYWIWRGSPFGYHCTNIVIHSLSGFLLFSSCAASCPGSRRKGRMATGLASIWPPCSWRWSGSCIPVHNAAVAYISGRADSPRRLFALSAWLLALRAMDSGLAVWKRAALGFLRASRS